MNRTTQRLLVVEDDGGARWALARLLRLEGYLVDEAANGVEALALYERVRPDAVLSDVEMPEMGGVELCRRLRAMPGGPPIVLMGSRHPSEPTLAPFVSKPVALDELLAALEASLPRVADPSS